MAGSRRGNLLDIDDGAVRAGAQGGIAADLAEGKLLKWRGEDEYSGRHCELSA